ncbi:hypothetical protein [Streptomyces sp. NPDC056470]
MTWHEPFLVAGALSGLGARWLVVVGRSMVIVLRLAALAGR